MSVSKVIDLSLAFSVLGLSGGHLFDVLIRDGNIFLGNYGALLSFGSSGVSLAGVMAGTAVAVIVFSLLERKKILVVSDEFVLPLCLFLVLVRIGDHLSGELYGSVTTAWLGVKFPGVEGFRHPVALYEALANLIIFFILLFIAGSAKPGRGKTTGHFIFWSGIGSLIIDYVAISSRHVSVHPGSRQFYFVLIIILGLLLAAYGARKTKKKYSDLGIIEFAPASFRHTGPALTGPVILKILLFTIILIFCLTLPGKSAQQATVSPEPHSLNRTI